MHILDYQHEADLAGNFHQQVNQPGKQPITLPLAHRPAMPALDVQQPPTSRPASIRTYSGALASALSNRTPPSAC